MRSLRLASMVGVSFMVFAGGTRRAAAISLPDSGSCNSSGSGACLQITNTSTSGGVAVSGVGGETGLDGTGYVSGVFGSSTTGIGVWGTTTSTSEPGVAGNGPYVGVYGFEGGTDSTDYGVLGIATPSGAGSAVYGDAAGSFVAWAGNFNGDVTGRDFYGNTFNPSDARLKKDIANASYGLNEVMKLRPVTYSWNEPEKHGNGRQVGLIAQEVQQIIPELVKSRGPDAMLALNYAGLVPVLVKAVQEQQAVIREQGREIAALQVERKGSASLPSGGTGVALAFGLLPIGLFVGRRLRRR